MRQWILAIGAACTLLGGCASDVSTAMSREVDEVPPSANKATISLSGWT